MAHMEGQEIISNLFKAAGLAHTISTMRPDIDHANEYVRSTTTCVFSIHLSTIFIKYKA